ncbi:MAG: hypothetical protein IJY04_02805, partial [Clostridia bacterium]|nr:hypothetical protein [Clostridia bacterium]
MQKEKIELEKSLRPKLTIISRSDRRYELRNESSGENVALKIWFANTDSIPEVGDIFYISENIIKG